MEPTLAEIRLFAGNFAPRGWALCEGQLLAINSNQALFSLLGTMYGGDGRVSFGLPDLRGRAPLGPGNGTGLTPRRLAERGGAESTVLNVNQIPAHTHPVGLRAQTGAADGRTPAGGVHLGAAGAPIYSAADGATADLEGLVVGEAGGNQPVSLMQPWLALNFIICTSGLFPSRN